MENGWRIDGEEIVFSAPCARACGERVEGRIGISEGISMLAGGRTPPRPVILGVKQALRVADQGADGEAGGDGFADLPFDGGIVCRACLETPLREVDHAE